MKKYKDIFANTDCVSEDMLTKYISGKLSPAEKHEVEKHLIDCEMCSDAVEGLSNVKNISGITSELNHKIQQRVEKKKEVKIIFLRQYRTQLAVAASIILIIGIVWFFKVNMSMKELDSTSAEKMFAEKFEPPPAEKDKDGKEKPDENNPVTAAEEQAPAKITLEEKKVESPAFSSAQGAKSGKDAAEEKHFGLAEKVPAQKFTQADIPAEEKEKNYRSKNAETPKGNVSDVSAKSEVTVRDEDAMQEIAVTKEVSKNQNELQKEKQKADETKKPDAVPSMTSAAGASATGNNLPASDKSGTLAQDNKKSSDDRNRADENKVKREQSGEGDVLAYGAGKKSEKKSEGKKLKKEKEAAPQKVSGGYYETQTVSAPAPVTQSQTKTQTVQTEANVKMDSVSVMDVSTVATNNISSTDSAMVKYDKQNYSGAVTDFESALKQNPNDEKALYYSAVSYLSLGQADKAITNLNKIVQNKNSKYYDDAQWYLSLAYIKNNDMKNARMNLIPLQNNSKSKYQKQADETLKEMKK
ncbi:MAG: tetratricopeptide repeat protein [Bacteroidetes bacterium]|nr:tetratricopeptide repeat protein [Bacteroidota bacterium]